MTPLLWRTFGACAVVAVTAAGCGFSPSDGTRTSSQREWEIQAAEGTFGVISNVVRCADTLFLADVHNQRIRRYDLANRKLLGDIDGGRVALPLAMTGDCGRQELYVMSPAPLRGGGGPVVQAFEMSSGVLRREYPLPNDFLPRPGGRAEAAVLVVAGLWARADHRPFLETSVDDFYETERLGLTLALESGAIEPLLLPYETRCIGAGQCPEVRLDSVVTPRGVMRIASLPTSTTVGVYRDNGPPRIVSVTSPLFVRSGETLEVTTPSEARVRWTGRNSIIDGVFAFQNVMAVVHVQRTIGPEWQFTSPIPTTAFMNTYAWDGTPRQRDVRLPGVAVGRDDGSIYAIDYGPEGPRQGVKQLRVFQVPVS